MIVKGLETSIKVFPCNPLTAVWYQLCWLPGVSLWQWDSFRDSEMSENLQPRWHDPVYAEDISAAAPADALNKIIHSLHSEEAPGGWAQFLPNGTRSCCIYFPQKNMETWVSLHRLTTTHSKFTSAEVPLNSEEFSSKRLSKTRIWLVSLLESHMYPYDFTWKVIWNNPAHIPVYFSVFSDMRRIIK